MRSGSYDNPVRPKGYKKPKSRLKARKSPLYVPPDSEAKKAKARWLRPR